MRLRSISVFSSNEDSSVASRGPDQVVGKCAIEIMRRTDFRRRLSTLFRTFTGLILIGSISACGDSDNRRGKYDGLLMTPAMMALVEYQEADEGKQKIGGLTKDELLAHVGIVQVGLALDMKCPTLTPEARASALLTATRAEEVMQSNGINTAIIERIHGSSRVLAANLDCDDSTKAMIGRVAPAAEQTCAAIAEGQCRPAVQGAG